MTFSKSSFQDLGEFARRFGRSMIGKVDVELPDVRLVSAEKLAADLCSIPAEDWWEYAFSREPLNGRFSPQQRKDMYLQAWACGVQRAQTIRETAGDLSVQELAEAMGLSVEFPDMPQSRARILFADFTEPDTVHVYRDGLSRGEALQQKPAVQKTPMAAIRIADVLIAHELFHVEELKHPKIWTRTYRVPLWRAGPFHSESPVAVLSEIAAMGFAAQLCALPFSPYVLDAFLAWAYSPKAGSALYQEMKEAALYCAGTETAQLVPAAGQ